MKKDENISEYFNEIKPLIRFASENVNINDMMK